MLRLNDKMNSTVWSFSFDMGNWVHGRMPQSDRDRGITFRWEKVMEALLRDTILFKKFFVKVIFFAVSEQYNVNWYTRMHRACFWRVPKAKSPNVYLFE